MMMMMMMTRLKSDVSENDKQQTIFWKNLFCNLYICIQYTNVILYNPTNSIWHVPLHQYLYLQLDTFHIYGRPLLLLLHGYPECPSLSHVLVSSFGNLLTPGLIEKVKSKVNSYYYLTIMTVLSTVVGYIIHKQRRPSLLHQLTRTQSALNNKHALTKRTYFVHCNFIQKSLLNPTGEGTQGVLKVRLKRQKHSQDKQPDKTDHPV